MKNETKALSTINQRIGGLHGGSSYKRENPEKLCTECMTVIRVKLDACPEQCSLRCGIIARAKATEHPFENLERDISYCESCGSGFLVVILGEFHKVRTGFKCSICREVE